MLYCDYNKKVLKSTEISIIIGQHVQKGEKNMEYTQILKDYKDILLPEDVQKILHTGRNTVYSYLADGTIKSIKVGGKYRIPKLYLLEFIYPDRIINPEEI